MRVCFKCAKSVALVDGHKVCSECHGAAGACGRCGFRQKTKRSQEVVQPLPWFLKSWSGPHLKTALIPGGGTHFCKEWYAPPVKQ